MGYFRLSNTERVMHLQSLGRDARGCLRARLLTRACCAGATRCSRLSATFRSCTRASTRMASSRCLTPPKNSVSSQHPSASLQHCGGPSWSGKRGQEIGRPGLVASAEGPPGSIGGRGLSVAVCAVRGVDFSVLNVCRDGPECPQPTPCSLTGNSYILLCITDLPLPSVQFPARSSPATQRCPTTQSSTRPHARPTLRRPRPSRWPRAPTRPPVTPTSLPVCSVKLRCLCARAERKEVLEEE